MKANLMKKILAGTMATMMVLGTTGTVLAKSPELPSVVQPHYSEIYSRSIKATFSTASSVRCVLSIKAISSSANISGTLTLSGSDGSEYSWNISGTSSVSFNRTISGCSADEYTLTFSGYCGSEYLNISSVATR